MADFDEYQCQYNLVEKAYNDYNEVLRKHQEETSTCGPHCDSFVLHSSGVCETCDKYAADLQEIRRRLNIAFTDEVWSPASGKRPCPATLLRPTEEIEHWYGNKPH